LRTPQSEEAGIRAYANWSRRLNIRGNTPIFLLPLQMIGLGIGSLAIKIGMTILHFWCWRSIQSIPRNFTRFAGLVDSFYPPELVPGAEVAHGRDRQGIFILSDLRWNFRNDPHNIMYHIEDIAKRERLIGYLFLSIFFLFAITYRWSIKIATGIFFAFLFDLRFRGGDGASGHLLKEAGRGWSVQQQPMNVVALVIGAVSLMALSLINGNTGFTQILTDTAGLKWLADLAGWLALPERRWLFVAAFAWAFVYLILYRPSLFVLGRSLDSGAATEAAIEGNALATRWLNAPRERRSC